MKLRRDIVNRKDGFYNVYEWRENPNPDPDSNPVDKRWVLVNVVPWYVVEEK